MLPFFSIPLAVVGELQINSKILSPEKRHGRLEIILALAQHAHLLALDLRLYFQLGLLDGLRHLFRLVRRDTALNLRHLAHRSTQR